MTTTTALPAVNALIAAAAAAPELAVEGRAEHSYVADLRRGLAAYDARPGVARLAAVRTQVLVVQGLAATPDAVRALCRAALREIDASRPAIGY